MSITAESVGAPVEAVIPGTSGPLPGSEGINLELPTNADAGLAEQEPGLSSPQDEYQFVLATGEKFRNADELRVAKEHASQKIEHQNEVIETLTRALANGQRNTAPAAPQADPQAALIAERAQELEQALWRKYPQSSVEDIKAQAQWDAEREIELEQRAEQRVMRKLSVRENEQALSQNQWLMDDWAQDLAATYRPRSVADHIRLCEKFAADYGKTVPTGTRQAAAAPARTSVDARMDASRQALRQPTGGTSAAAGNGAGSSVNLNSSDPRVQGVNAAWSIWEASNPNADPAHAAKIKNTMLKSAGLIR